MHLFRLKTPKLGRIEDDEQIEILALSGSNQIRHLQNENIRPI